MIRILQKLILLTVFLVPMLLSSPIAAAFNPFGSVCSNSDAATSPACHQNKDQNGKTTDPAVNIIRTAANIIAIVAGIAAVIMIIISGFQFVTAGGAVPGQRSGDTNKIKSARSTLIGALVGLVIIALAWTIVTFVTDHFIS
ncbi:MAG TPA: hypothetical protein VFH37_03380 [Candidatus Saccharimonadales bacterium]|nr:hypothetical protein [Candidatus Saccharimonadales bacterium]